MKTDTHTQLNSFLRGVNCGPLIADDVDEALKKAKYHQRKATGWFTTGSPKGKEVIVYPLDKKYGTAYCLDEITEKDAIELAVNLLAAVTARRQLERESK